MSGLSLADAFSEFIAASGRLEHSYRDLQQEVAQLSLELAARNAALNASLEDNERMRLALAQIVDSMPCGVLVIDADGAVATINPESRRLLGLGAAPARSIAEICQSSSLQLETFYSNEKTGEAEQELAHTSSAGKRWLGIRKRRLLVPSCTAAGRQEEQTILILRDITTHKAAEQERETARKAMALAEVAALLAHEIRNPLASLELFAGLIAEDAERRPEWIGHLRAGIRSLAGTVTNVLSFHSLGRMQRSSLELAAALSAAVEFTRPIAEQAGLLLEFACADEHAAALQVSGNQGALQQVVLNLVSNAIRHTERGGRIDVALEASACGERALVAFRDTGCGITEAQLMHIFEPGYSGSGNTCGLGLAVCRQIIAHHEGEIRATSRQNHGTTFHVELPAL